MKITWWVLVATVLLFGSTGWAGSIEPVATLGELGANDQFDWAGYGPGGTPIVPSTALWSASHGNAEVGGSLIWVTGYYGTVMARCRDSKVGCWDGGFPAGDTLVTSEDYGVFMFNLMNPVTALGAYVEAASPGEYTIEYSVKFGDGEYSEYQSLSVPNGGPVFLGVRDTSGIGILGIGLYIGAATPMDGLAMDTLYTSGSSATPEPAGLGVLGCLGLAAAGFIRRRTHNR